MSNEDKVPFCQFFITLKLTIRLSYIDLYFLKCGGITLLGPHNLVIYQFLEATQFLVLGYILLITQD